MNLLCFVEEIVSTKAGCSHQLFRNFQLHTYKFKLFSSLNYFVDLVKHYAYHRRQRMRAFLLFHIQQEILYVLHFVFFISYVSKSSFLLNIVIILSPYWRSNPRYLVPWKLSFPLSPSTSIPNSWPDRWSSIRSPLSTWNVT